MQILIIDDNPHVRDSLKQMLEQLSLDAEDILESSCEPAALGLIQKHRPELIITDAKLLLSEAVLLEQLNIRQATGRIIVTSSHEFVLQAFCRGGIDSLLKPIGLGELEAALLGSAGTSGSYGNPYLEQAELEHSDPMI